MSVKIEIYQKQKFRLQVKSLAIRYFIKGALPQAIARDANFNRIFWYLFYNFFKMAQAIQILKILKQFFNS